MKRIQTFLISFLLLATLCGCKISGTVTDAGTGEPIEGVTVTVTGYYDTLTAQGPVHFEPLYSTKTDSSGNYSIMSFMSRKDGYVLVDFTKDGHTFWTTPRYVPATGTQIHNALGVKTDNPDIYKEDITVTSPEDLERISGYSILLGNMTISGTTLTDLDGLNTLKAVMGYLTISGNPQLRDIKDLSSLKTAWMNLVIEDNASLENLNGLSGLFSGSVSIINNPLLKNLSGLDLSKNPDCRITIESNEHLESLEGVIVGNSANSEVWIQNNPSLKNLSGVSLPKDYRGSLQIRTETPLSLHGIENLTSIHSLGLSGPIPDFTPLKNITTITILEIMENPEISDVSTFGNLTGLTVLSVYKTRRLNDLSGFENISSLDILYVEQNEAIESLHAFRGIKALKELAVIKNPRLNELGLDALTEIRNDWPQKTYLTIEDNPELCTSLAEALVAGLDDATRSSFYIKISGNRECAE